MTVLVTGAAGFIGAHVARALAARGERVRLGASEFSMERGAKFRAVLKVRAGGREICRDISS